MTLPALAAERRAAAPAAALLLPGARRCRSISFARTQQQTRRTPLLVRLMGQTD